MLLGSHLEHEGNHHRDSGNVGPRSTAGLLKEIQKSAGRGLLVNI